MRDHFTIRQIASVAIGLALAIGAVGGARTANAASVAPVGLGSAAAFAILAGTPAITNTGPTTVTGDVGIHPAAAVTGFPPGTVIGTIHAANAVALQAKSDLVIAYGDAASRAPATTLAGGTLGGLTLVGGVYSSGGATLGLTGTLTLDAQNDPSTVWIFQATSDLITASSSTVSIVNGGQPCNVFWQVTSSATLGSSSSFAGTIMALTSITMNSGVTLRGRALARNGSVTLIDDTITRSTCALATTATPGPTTTPTLTPAPTTPASAAPTTPSPAPAPTAATLPSTATVDDGLMFLALPTLLVVFVVLYLVARARRRRAHPAS